jgi:hypothetical protein
VPAEIDKVVGAHIQEEKLLALGIASSAGRERMDVDQYGRE